MPKKTIRDVEVRGRRVLIRADLNVPLDASRSVTDDRRIRQFLPTLQHILAQGGRAIVMSHLGRPTGDPTADAAFSLRPVARHMEELLGRPVQFAPAVIGPTVEGAAVGLADGEVLLIENLRFHRGETIIDKARKQPDGKLTPEQDAQRQELAKGLAALGEVYVNDAFGTCHRNHVSMYDVPLLMPAGNRVMGFLVEKELRYLGEALESPQAPFVAILGGAKVSDKIGVIRKLIPKVDAILVGGAMTYTFWQSQGRAVGRSLVEADKVNVAQELLQLAGPKLVLPVDSVAAKELKAGVESRIIEGDLPDDLMGLDIGPKTLDLFAGHVRTAKTIVWNGPVGAFETRPFDAGTLGLADLVAAATDAGAVSIVGGGDTAAAIEQAGVADRMTHVSTGGGASLQFLEGERFGPIDILDDA